MKLILTGLNIDGYNKSILLSAEKLMKDYLAKNNIKCKIEKGEKDNALIFIEMEKGRIAKSTVDNMILMKDGDARIKELNRKHLVSERLTKEQFEVFKFALYNYLGTMGIKYSLLMQEFDDEKSVIPLMEGGKIIKDLPQPLTFPVKMEV